MKNKRRNFSTKLKRTGLIVGSLILLVIILDNVVMPLYVQKGMTTQVPNVLGMPVPDALRLLAEHGLEGKESEVRQDKFYPIGTVAFQNPAPDAVVKYGRGVYLTISGGESMIVVPAFRGRSLRDAMLSLERLGLRIGDLRYEVSPDYPENTIIEQSIVESTRVRSGTTVMLVVSQGPSGDRIPVPFVLKKTLAEAQRMILNSGFQIGQITYQMSLDFLPNTVIDQYPRFGSFAALGDSISLFITQKSDTGMIREY